MRGARRSDVGPTRRSRSRSTPLSNRPLVPLPPRVPNKQVRERTRDSRRATSHMAAIATRRFPAARYERVAQLRGDGDPRELTGPLGGLGFAGSGTRRRLPPTCSRLAPRRRFPVVVHFGCAAPVTLRHYTSSTLLNLRQSCFRGPASMVTWASLSFDEVCIAFGRRPV